MPKKPRVLLDVDGVLLDFLTPAIHVLNHLTGRTHSPEDLQDWDIFSLYPRKYEAAFYAMCGAPGFCQALEPLPHAVELVEALQEVSDLYIVTSPMDAPTWTWERERALERYFGIGPHRILHARSKHICQGDALIEDRPRNLDTWVAEHPKGAALLWDAPYNRSNTTHTRVRTVNEVLARVRALTE